MYRLLRTGSIRLLGLLPHEDENARIQCQLFEYPLQVLGDGTHLYEALSYVWHDPDDPDDPHNPCYVSINKHDFPSQQTSTRHCCIFEIVLLNGSYGSMLSVSTKETGKRKECRFNTWLRSIVKQVV